MLVICCGAVSLTVFCTKYIQIYSIVTAIKGKLLAEFGNNGGIKQLSQNPCMLFIFNTWKNTLFVVQLIRGILHEGERMKNFITIEGCDGVGKTFQTRLFKEYCQQNGIDHIVFTREPGGSNIAEQIRGIILDANNSEMDDLCEAFLYASARIQHLHDIVKPALAQGKVVFCDRFVDSSYVYQGLGRNLGLQKIIDLNALAVGEYMPEFTIFLDLSPQKAFERKGGADVTDRLENVDFSFHQQVYDGYKLLIEQDPDRFEVIDASGTIEETQQKLREVLIRRGIL